MAETMKVTSTQGIEEPELQGLHEDFVDGLIKGALFLVYHEECRRTHSVKRHQQDVTTTNKVNGKKDEETDCVECLHNNVLSTWPYWKMEVGHQLVGECDQLVRHNGQNRWWRVPEDQRRGRKAEGNCIDRKGDSGGYVTKRSGECVKK